MKTTRRSFLSFLGMAAVAAPVVPELVKAAAPKSPPPHFTSKVVGLHIGHASSAVSYVPLSNGGTGATPYTFGMAQEKKEGELFFGDDHDAFVKAMRENMKNTRERIWRESTEKFWKDG